MSKTEFPIFHVIILTNERTPCVKNYALTSDTTHTRLFRASMNSCAVERESANASKRGQMAENISPQVF